MPVFTGFVASFKMSENQEKVSKSGEDASSVEYSLLHSSAKGYASGSSGERLPIEEAVIEVTKAYKNCKIR